MIKGEIEEIEKAEKLGGNLEYTEFDFQVIIPKFYSIEKFSGEIEIEIRVLEASPDDFGPANAAAGNYTILKSICYIIT